MMLPTATVKEPLGSATVSRPNKRLQGTHNSKRSAAVVRPLSRGVRLHMNSPLYASADRLRFASWLAIAAWALLLVVIVHFILSVISPLRAVWGINDLVFISVLCLFLVFALSYVLVAYGLQCPSCGRRFLVQGIGAKHSNASRIFGMDHWASAIVDVVRRGQCICMYCGAKICTR